MNPVACSSIASVLISVTTAPCPCARTSPTAGVSLGVMLAMVSGLVLAIASLVKMLAFRSSSGRSSAPLQCALMARSCLSASVAASAAAGFASVARFGPLSSSHTLVYEDKIVRC